MSSNCTEQPAPRGDCARKPMRGSIPGSRAKYRTRRQVSALVEAWNANACPSRATRRLTASPATGDAVDRECLPEPSHPQAHGVPVDRERVAVVRDVARHDGDDHRLVLQRELEGKLCPPTSVCPDEAE